MENKQKQTPILSIVGKSNSGKTTLIESLIIILKAKGYKIATIKHDAHSFEVDYPGKDSWRHREAGANAVVISSSSKLFLTQNLDEELSIHDIYNNYFKDLYDIIITEGYRKEQTPKIEVHRLERSNDLLYQNGESNFIAIASNQQWQDLPIPVLDLNDVESIANFVEQKLIKRM